MKVSYLNNSGGGFTQEKQVPEGTTIGEFVKKSLDMDPALYSIRVNNRVASEDQELFQGDCVLTVPINTKGGRG